MLHISQNVSQYLPFLKNRDVKQFAEITKAIISYIISTKQVQNTNPLDTNPEPDLAVIIGKMYQDLGSDDDDFFSEYQPVPIDKRYYIAAHEQEIEKACVALSSSRQFINGCALIALICGYNQGLKNVHAVEYTIVLVEDK